MRSRAGGGRQSAGGSESLNISTQGTRIHIPNVLPAQMRNHTREVSWQREELATLSARLGISNPKGNQQHLEEQDKEETLVSNYLDCKEFAECKAKSRGWAVWKLVYKSSLLSRKRQIRTVKKFFAEWKVHSLLDCHEEQQILEQMDRGLYIDDPCDLDQAKYGFSQRRGLAPNPLQSPAKKCISAAFQKLLRNASLRRESKHLNRRAKDNRFVRTRERKMVNTCFFTWLQTVRTQKEERHLEKESSGRQERISQLVANLRAGGHKRTAGSGAGAAEVKPPGTSHRAEEKIFGGQGRPRPRPSAEVIEGRDSNERKSSERSNLTSPLFSSPPRSPSIIDDNRVRVISNTHSARSPSGYHSPSLRKSKDRGWVSPGESPSRAEEKSMISPRLSLAGGNGSGGSDVSTRAAFGPDLSYRHRDLKNGIFGEEEEHEDSDLPPPPAYDTLIVAESAKSASAGDGRRGARSTPKSMQKVEYSTTVRLTGGPVSKDQRNQEREDRRREMRKKAEAIMAARRAEDEMRVKKREEKEEREVAKALEDKRRAREALTGEERAKMRAQQASVERLKRLSQKAKWHYNFQLLIKYGFAPLRILSDMAATNRNKADIFYADLLIRRYWCLLYGYCNSFKLAHARREKRLSATAYAHYRQALLLQTLRVWKLRRRMLRAKAVAVSGQANVFSKKKRALRAWRLAFDRETRMSAMKMRKVTPRGNRCALRYYWAQWLRLVEEERLDREIRVRSKHTWDRVRDWMKK